MPSGIAGFLLSISFSGHLSTSTVSTVTFTPVPPLAFRVRGLTEAEKCRYTGVALAYERTWEERRKFGDIETIEPPALGVAEGYAVLINKKECEGKPPETVHLVATPDYGSILVKKRMLFEGVKVQANGLNGMREDQRPKWLAQAFQTIELAAETDPVAKDFVTSVRAAAIKDVATTQAAPQAQLQGGPQPSDAAQADHT